MDHIVKQVEGHRKTILRKNLVDWMQRKELNYHSPRKLWHGHFQYGFAHSKSQADFKAVSLNVMHESTQITDQVYSNISEDERQKRIQDFSIMNSSAVELDNFRLFQEFLAYIKTKASEK